MGTGRILTLAAVLIVTTGGGLLALVVGRAPDAGHTLLHIGCKHHNHGPKWHDGHGRALGITAGRLRQAVDDEPAGASMPPRSEPARR